MVATGTKTNYFGNKEIERNSMSMKTIPQSLNIRSLILESFEAALLTDDEAERERSEVSCQTAKCQAQGPFLLRIY